MLRVTTLHTHGWPTLKETQEGNQACGTGTAPLLNKTSGLQPLEILAGPDWVRWSLSGGGEGKEMLHMLLRPVLPLDKAGTALRASLRAGTDGGSHGQCWGLIPHAGNEATSVGCTAAPLSPAAPLSRGGPTKDWRSTVACLLGALRLQPKASPIPGWRLSRRRW